MSKMVNVVKFFAVHLILIKFLQLVKIFTKNLQQSIFLIFNASNSNGNMEELEHKT